MTEEKTPAAFVTSGKWVIFLVKLTGGTLIILCTSMTGLHMASGLSKRVSAIEQNIALLLFFHDQLRYFQLPVDELLEASARLEQFRSMAYLTDCLEAIAQGGSFSASWADALQSQQMTLGGRETEILASLGEVLGATDLDSQLSTLAYTREQLNLCLHSAREKCAKLQKMYGALGVLTGIAIVIVLA